MRYPKSYNQIKINFYLCFTLIPLFFNNGYSATFDVTVADNAVTPANISANAGDIIRWIWKASIPVSIKCDGIFPGTSLPHGASSWDETLNSGNSEFEYSISATGTYYYSCIYNSSVINGTITVDSPLPVELTDFVATTIKNEVILDWVTGGEINNDRFEIQRVEISEVKDHNPEDLHYVTVGMLRGQGTANTAHSYKFIDKNLKSGIYLYRLRQVDFNSHYLYHLLNERVVVGIPEKFSISQNYPNPFNPVTKINYELPEDGFVKISLIDITGRSVSTLVNTQLNAGYQTLEVNGSAYSSGVYYYRIEFNNARMNEMVTKKMMLIK